MSNPTFSQYRAAASRMSDFDDCQIDENAIVSKGDDAGAYVQAWVWVPDSACDDETLGEDEEE